MVKLNSHSKLNELVPQGVEVRSASRHFGNESSDENYAFNREVRGSRNVTKSYILILEPKQFEGMREW